MIQFEREKEEKKVDYQRLELSLEVLVNDQMKLSALCCVCGELQDSPVVVRPVVEHCQWLRQSVLSQGNGCCFYSNLQFKETEDLFVSVFRFLSA